MSEIIDRRYCTTKNFGNLTQRRAPKLSLTNIRFGETTRKESWEAASPKFQLKKKMNSQNQSSIFCNNLESNKKHSKNYVEAKLQFMKTQLQKLSYKDKLSELQELIRKSRELCHIYGYFYPTITMFDFTKQNPMKLSLWVHSNPRRTKPLHPIKKKNDFQCELEFISSLKKTLKEIFPTIDFGSGKTFVKMLLHFANLKGLLMKSIEQNFGPKISSKRGEKTQAAAGNHSSLIKSLKVIPHKRISEEPYEIYKNERSPQQYQKETISTLMQSFKSEKSFQERMQSLISSPSSFQKAKQRKSVQIQTNNLKENQNLVTKQRKNESEKKEIQQKECPESPGLKRSFLVPKGISEEQKKRIKHSILKNSRLGNHMATSLEIQSQLQNLFDGQEFPHDMYNMYYGKNATIKNSELSKVAEQFEQLFF